MDRPNIEEIERNVKPYSTDLWWHITEYGRRDNLPTEGAVFVIGVRACIAYIRHMESTNAELRAALHGCKEGVQGFKDGLKSVRIGPDSINTQI